MELPGRYRVIAGHTVDGVAQGNLVDVADPVRARRLIRSGVIERLQCPGCGAAFKTATKLDGHVAKAHTDDDGED